MSFNIRYKTKSWLRSNYIRNKSYKYYYGTQNNNTLEQDKTTRDTFSKIALTKELDELVTKYKNELITKFQREKK